MDNLPNHAMIVGEDGMPKSVVDIGKMQSDATRLMYQMAAAAGDDAELDRIGTEWAMSHDPDYFGYIAAGALSLLVRNILEPTLQVIDEVLPHIGLRAKITESRDNAEETLK